MMKIKLQSDALLFGFYHEFVKELYKIRTLERRFSVKINIKMKEGLYANGISLVWRRK